MTQPTIRDLITSINKNELSPVYILMGEEDYYLDVIVDLLEEKSIEEEDKDFNYNVYYGVDADIEIIISACQQLPVMAPRRLVILKEAQTMQRSKQQMDKFAQYVNHPNSSTIFVIVYKGESLNATSELMKAAKKSDVVVLNSVKIKDYQLPGQVKDYCAARKCNIDEKSVSMLCEYIGGPLTKLFGEINKLISIKGGGSGLKIVPEDIEKHIGISKDFNNFELTTALAKKNYPRAIAIVKYFQANPKANQSVFTTTTIFNFFSKLVIAHYLPDKSDASLRQALGLKTQGALIEIKEGLRNYNAYRAVNAIHAIREFDVQSKGVGSTQNEYNLLIELIFKLFTF